MDLLRDGSTETRGCFVFKFTLVILEPVAVPGKSAYRTTALTLLGRQERGGEYHLGTTSIRLWTPERLGTPRKLNL